MSSTNRKIRVIKREERFRKDDAVERDGETSEQPSLQEGVNEREVVPVVEGWIKEFQRHKESARKSI